MTRWTHTITFDTEGLTLIEWHAQELPKYIKKYEKIPEYHDSIVQAKAILKLLEELGLTYDGVPTISRP